MNTTAEFQLSCMIHSCYIEHHSIDIEIRSSKHDHSNKSCILIYGEQTYLITTSLYMKAEINKTSQFVLC